MVRQEKPKIEISQQGMEELMKNLELVLMEAVDYGIEATRNDIHVVTGKLKKSIRRFKLKRSPRLISVEFVAGGRHETGNDGKHQPVDYALVEEIRHPIIRATYPKAVQEYLRGKA